jgi:hypothetical protein
MATVTLPRSGDADTTPVPSGRVQRLIVTWQHPESRDVSPIGILRYDGSEYTFEYLRTAATVSGFRLLLGFPELGEKYTSGELFPLFAQRALDPSRPDYQRYVADLGLEDGATPWEQISRSSGAREGDTLQLFPVPRYTGEVWTCYILVHGMRYLLEKDVAFAGTIHEKYDPLHFEEVLEDLAIGDSLIVEHERDNKFSRHALLATTTGHEPLGWVPNWFAGEVFELQSSGALEFSVDRVNPPEAGWHMRLVARMDAKCGADFRFFTGENWLTYS